MARRPSARLGAGVNPAYYYGLLGAAVLLLTFWLPVASAGRTARVEERADVLASLLLEAAVCMHTCDFADPATGDYLFGQMQLLGRGQVFLEDLEPLRDEWVDAFTFANKHYVVQVRPAPRAEVELTSAASEDLGSWPLEVLAWPRSDAGPGHAVFFYPEDAPAAFTRNLQFGYYGDASDQRRPPPGLSHRRPDAKRRWDYRDFADNRWLVRRGHPGKPPAAAP
jgi:hypothetical protein